jgi:two-component system LytT family response regulator
MFKVLIVDDEPLAADLVQEYLEAFPDFEVVGRCLDGFAAMKSIQQEQPDLVFLDVQMPKLTGFDLLELLEDPPAIIFTTAFDEFAIKAFEANAVDYLLKPFSEERFEQSLVKFQAQPKHLKSTIAALQKERDHGPKDRLVVKDGARIRIIPFPDLIRIEADGDYVQIVSKNGKYAKKKTLSYYQKLLPQPTFLRVHRSHLVNVEKIVRLDPYGKNDHLALLQDDSRIPVSRSGFAELKEVLGL